jgi:hypothetical protein
MDTSRPAGTFAAIFDPLTQKISGSGHWEIKVPVTFVGNVLPKGRQFDWTAQELELKAQIGAKTVSCIYMLSWVKRESITGRAKISEWPTSKQWPIAILGMSVGYTISWDEYATIPGQKYRADLTKKAGTFTATFDPIMYTVTGTGKLEEGVSVSFCATESKCRSRSWTDDKTNAGDQGLFCWGGEWEFIASIYSGDDPVVVTTIYEFSKPNFVAENFG